MTSNEKEAEEHRGHRKASEGAEANHCDQPLIEDRLAGELFELQKRMFQNS
jgi:hypothetical protein